MRLSVPRSLREQEFRMLLQQGESNSSCILAQSFEMYLARHISRTLLNDNIFQIKTHSKTLARKRSRVIRDRHTETKNPPKSPMILLTQRKYYSGRLAHYTFSTVEPRRYSYLCRTFALGSGKGWWHNPQK